MAASLRLLDSDGITPFVSQNYGNVLAGTQSTPKLLFVNSYGDADAEGSEFGVESIAGNDGYTFTEINAASPIDATGIVVTGSVVPTGGTVGAGSIEYEVAVMDRWGNISTPCPVPFVANVAAGTTNKISLTWTAVPGAYKYVVYSKIGAGNFYKVGEVVTNAFADLAGTNDGSTVPKIAGYVAYQQGATWQTTPLSLGTLAPGTKTPVLVRENVPAGTTSLGNPRQHKCYVAFLTV